LVAIELAYASPSSAEALARRLASNPMLRDPAHTPPAPVLRLGPEAAVDRAAFTLRELPEERRDEVMREADTLLADRVGRAPSEEPGGLLGSPLGRARVRVAAELARSNETDAAALAAR